MTLSQHAITGEERGGEAGGIESGKGLALHGNDGKAVAAHAVVGGVDDGKGCGDGESSVDGVAAVMQDVQTRLCGQRVRRGDHAAMGIDEVALGGEGVVLRVEMHAGHPFFVSDGGEVCDAASAAGIFLYK